MMKNSCRLLLILIGLWMANVSLAQKTFRNPIITGMNPDPSICRVGDDFYLVTSTFEYFPGLPVYHSKDLVHWKLIGHALSRPENNPLMGCNASTGGQYAPTLRYHDGTFYVIGTNYGGKGSQGVFYQDLKKLKCPVLALNGEKDIQVDAAMNLTAIQERITGNGNKNVTVKAYPKLNHLFQTCEKGTLAEYVIIARLRA